MLVDVGFFKDLKELINVLFFFHNTVTFPVSKWDTSRVAVFVLLSGSITSGSIITNEVRDKLTKSMIFSLGCNCFAIYNRKGRGILLVVIHWPGLFAWKY